MKITLVGPGIMPIPPTGWGAVEILVWDTKNALEELGHEVQIINTKDYRQIINGINVIVDIDWQGTRQIEQNIPDDIVKIFILPPSIKELEKRLGTRATESQDSFKKRMSEARKEISHYSEYDFIIINEDIQESVNKIKTILYSESLRRHRQVGLNKFVDNLI